MYLFILRKYQRLHSIYQIQFPDSGIQILVSRFMDGSLHIKDERSVELLDDCNPVLGFGFWFPDSGFQFPDCVFRFLVPYYHQAAPRSKQRSDVNVNVDYQ